MSKYIIEIPDGTPYVLLRGDEFGVIKEVPVSELEELNSDYINEHYGELQDDAYKRGLSDVSASGYRRQYEDGYRRGYKNGRNIGIKDGMCDAWEAARKLFSSMADSDIEKAFPTEWNNGGFKALMNLQPQEAIAKLKSYEERKADPIKVGDEVINNTTGTKGILVEPETEYLLATVIVPNNRWSTFNISHTNLTKTGKHYDIASILEAMRE